MRRHLIIFSIALIFVFAAGSTWAGSLSVPNTFSAGSTAKASEVNANFTEVENEVTDNANDIAENADDIASNADSITDVKDELSDKMDQVLTCSNNQVLKWNGADWVCAEDIDTVNTDADTLDGMDSTDFAASIHSHPELATGVHWISPPQFVPTDTAVVTKNSVHARGVNTLWPAISWAPVHIPFKCTITEIQFQARDNTDTGEVFIGIYDHQEDPVTEDDVPLLSLDTSGFASTSSNTIFTSGPVSLTYDPTDFVSNREWYISVELDEEIDYTRLRWVRMFYTIP